MDLREVSDRLEINELLARYCHALDLKDWPAFRAIFSEGATIDYSEFGGPFGDVQELEDFLSPVLDSLISSQHMVSTVMIDFDGDVANVRSTAIVPLTSAAIQGGEHTLFNGLWYEDKLIRTAKGWRISHRKLVRGWELAPHSL